MYQRLFSSDYAAARQRFLEAAGRVGGQVQSLINPAGPGRHGEDLCMDVAFVGDTSAPALLVMTSGVHGEEGYCGSGCQIALLEDEALLDRAAAGSVAILVIHAVNPFGFSWGHRTNEDNIDLNRNFCDFSRSLRDNPHYGDLHPLLVPDVWPPSAENEAAIKAFVQREGERAYRVGLMQGQHTHPDGLFYGGRAPAWSNVTLRSIISGYGQDRRRIGWIDYHTGLGPYGHGEKIFVQDDRAAFERALSWWGQDVTAVSDPGSSTVDIDGTLWQALFEECPDVPELTFMAMEYGTVPLDQVALALRADRWLAAHPDTGDEMRQALKQQHRDAFCPDHDDWRGAVLGQSRVSLLQAIIGLSEQ